MQSGIHVHNKLAIFSSLLGNQQKIFVEVCRLFPLFCKQMMTPQKSFNYSQLFKAF